LVPLLEKLRSRYSGCRGSALIQEQVDCPLGGVAFSRDEHVTIEVGRGTSGVTSGEKPLARITCDGDLARVHPLGEAFPVAELTRKLVPLVRQLCAHFGWSVDLEWGYLAGCVFILQVRPVTHDW
jgi:hypothetical protein